MYSMIAATPCLFVCLQVKAPQESRALAKLHPMQFVGGSRTLYLVTHDGKVMYSTVHVCLKQSSFSLTCTCTFLTSKTAHVHLNILLLLYL